MHACPSLCLTMRTPPRHDPATGSPLLKPREAAAALAISRQTLYTWVRDGRVPSVRIGRWLRFREADLAALREHGPHSAGTAPIHTFEPPPPSHLTPQQIADLKTLRRAIYRSGLSARMFATRVIDRDERTVRRWLAGDVPVPPRMADHLRAMAAEEPAA